MRDDRAAVGAGCRAFDSGAREEELVLIGQLGDLRRDVLGRILQLIPDLDVERVCLLVVVVVVGRIGKYDVIDNGVAVSLRVRPAKGERLAAALWRKVQEQARGQPVVVVVMVLT